MAAPVGTDDPAFDARLAAQLFALDPPGLGGLIVKAPSGEARDAYLRGLERLLPRAAPVRKLPVSCDDDRLLGGLDLAATLAASRPVVRPGLLVEANGGLLLVPMAERLEGAKAGRIAAAMDEGRVRVERDGVTAGGASRFGLLLLDEGIGEETPPRALCDRCGPRLRLPHAPIRGALGSRRALEAARRRLRRQGPPPDALLEVLCRTAEELGLRSARDALLALAWARASAALFGRPAPGPEDAALAARLVLLTRAGLELPGEEEPPASSADADAGAPDETEPPGAAEPPPRPDDLPDAPADPDPGEPGSEPPDLGLMVAAVRAALPQNLLDLAASARASARGPRSRGGGERTVSRSRGRPLRSRPGPLGGGARLDLVATLKAAAPWRRVRSPPPTGGVAVRPEDFRTRRFVQKREATVVFLVDASGSSALQRLGEAKGAVELLLSQAYVSRTRAALIAFRGSAAEVLLEPTRSVARARRRLADLAGGGGTPLASAFDRGLTLALEERRRSRTPLIVVLTDGRANIDRAGGPGRPAAERDAAASAAAVRDAGIKTVYIDTAPRPAPDGDRWARALGGRYIPLPFADARALGALAGALRAEAG